MKIHAPISDIMTKKVITLKTTDDLETAELLFKTHNIRHIPVVNGNDIVGMLSYTDLLRISFADAVNEDDNTVESLVYNMFTIDQVMAKKLISVPPTATIKEVAEILAMREFHALPVLQERTIVGIVTTTDLIKYMLKQF
ncbi:CBS domain-containing protein [Mangrovimonas cancribranchiae]|uniref:CBS domain-containing protein n=1 Tax=Mangrovimonas cancribranchiae TaxID=3080055 RepID=A0AAU6P2P2_9FLAO